MYDISGFDQHAVYGPNPNYATEVQEISSSNDDDSDIEILETINWKDYKSRKSSKEGFKSIIMKRVRESGAQPDEPVPGPSGILSAKSSEQLEISESDPEEIKVLDYVKPEPEVVVLSSGEDVPALSDSDVSKGECVEVINDKIRKSTRARLSSDEEYAPSSERGRNRSKGGKGKCKSNGFGLKGKQKQKYITSKKYRSCSTDSTSSSSSISTSSSKSSSSVSSIHKSKRKKTKTSRKKCKRKVTVKSLQKVSENKRRKVISSGSDSDGNHSKTKKRVKSCVIVPNTKSSDSPPIVYKLKISSTSNDHELDKNHRYPASYWSTFVNPEYEKSRRRREKSADKKPKQKMCNSSSEDMPSRRVRHSSNLSNSPTHNISADESLSVRRSSKNESSKTSKQFKCHGDKGKRYRDSYYNHNSQSENLPYPCASGSCEASLTFSTFSPSTSHDSMTS